jgi:allantoinase
MDLVLRGDRVLIDATLRPAAVAVENGRVVAIGAPDADHGAAEQITVPAPVVLLPGFVDTHVHIDEPGTDWEGFATATDAAASAGITTLVDMPLDSVPVTTTVAALNVKKAAAQGKCRVAVQYWAGVVPGNLGTLHELAAAGVRGFKCFLADSGHPDFPPLSPQELRVAAAEVAALDSVLLVHAESHDVLADCAAPSGPDYGSFLASRPDAAEVVAVRAAIGAARDTGARIHIVHVSSADVLGLLAEAKSDGVAVSAETCPHYLLFEAEAIPRGDTRYAVCPPIRDRANRERLWAALADGTLDMVVSDHSPGPPEAAGWSDFGRAIGGIRSLQFGPRAVWSQAADRGFGVGDLSRWMSQRPAELAGFGDRGRISVGARADLCAFDPDAVDTVAPTGVRHRHPASPYVGMTLRGRVLTTWVAGRSVSPAVGAVS